MDSIAVGRAGMKIDEAVVADSIEAVGAVTMIEEEAILIEVGMAATKIGEAVVGSTVLDVADMTTEEAVMTLIEVDAATMRRGEAVVSVPTVLGQEGSTNEEEAVSTVADQMIYPIG